MIIIAPSILASDFTRLREEMADVLAGGADWLHIDVMDGLFVPNISIGLPVLRSIRRATDGFLDVHLMIDRPKRYVKRFCEAGADLVTFHVESAQPQAITEAIAQVKEAGKQVGLVLKPKTPVECVVPWLEQLDLILVMTVEPGFGGQSFMEDQLPRLRRLREMLRERNLSTLLEVDGGITVQTAPLAVKAGADVLVAGSAVFGYPDRRAAISALRDACE